MRDISSKQITLRTAEAIAMLHCAESTLAMIRDQALPKGNAFEIAKAAGLLGAKNTSSLIPHCHPVSIDSMDIRFAQLDPAESLSSGIRILATGKSIGRTGIEMEVLTAVTVSALTLYDLLKPVDEHLEITGIRLLQKTGGKSDRNNLFSQPPTCAILVCSDSAAAGKQEDRSGLIIRLLLREANAEVSDYLVIADDKKMIQSQIKAWVKQDIQFIFTTGGTGLGPRDHTVTAVAEILERDAPGIPEAMRSFGQQRNPLAMMSGGIAGSIGQTLIITLPGSPTGARESLEAILPGVFHARSMLKGGGH
ncbi:MAG TPA: bifunctional molybdenum cofactor biosynthesis protein MoaC/MoaB [Chitinophagaceae bacterium]|nr:bifunctional molybdenum cofactor biosynthesis protein MoaC/MoaB [Chitinophagaceae bacterium]